MIGQHSDSAGAGERTYRWRTLTLNRASRTFQASAVPDAVAVAILLAFSLSLRLATSGLFSLGISTDEYRYSITAQEWIGIASGTSSMSFRDIVVHHPLVPVFAAFGAIVAGIDPLQAGRGLQLMFNAVTVPTVYLLMRCTGLPIGAAFSAAAGLAVMPGFWQASAAFLPDSQLAFTSTLVFLGLVMWLRGVSSGTWLAAAALGVGFLTKEHLPLVIAPALAVLYTASIKCTAACLRVTSMSVVTLGCGLTLAVILSAFGLGVPRAIVLAVIGGSLAEPSILDGLPPLAPSLDESAGGSWIASLSNALRTGSFGLEWFGSAFGVNVVGGAIVAIGLVGSVCLATTVSRHRRLKMSRRTVTMSIAVTVPAVLFLGQIVASAAWDAMLAATVMTLIVLFASLNDSRKSLPHERETNEPSAGGSRLPQAFLASQAVYIATTIGFFALRLEQVSFLPRMFLPIMPSCAVFFGIGCLYIGRSIRALSTRLSPALLVAFGILALGLVVLPGGPITKGITAALAFVAREREFRGYPDDPYYQRVSGGIRVATFRRAEPWLRSNVAPEDRTITSKPYQLSWHGDLGITGFRSIRAWDEIASDRRRYLSDDILRSGNYDWIIDFNQFAVQTESPEGLAFEEDYRWLQLRPYLQEAYAARDDQGRILLYAFRHVSE